jgi:hypothetical protein
LSYRKILSTFASSSSVNSYSFFLFSASAAAFNFLIYYLLLTLSSDGNVSYQLSTQKLTIFPNFGLLSRKLGFGADSLFSSYLGASFSFSIVYSFF